MNSSAETHQAKQYGSRPAYFLFIALFIILGSFVLIFGMLASISIGMADIRLSTVFQAIFAFEPTKEHLIIRTLRLPRAVMGLLIGANLAVAGALMQAVTRNPLASPQVFGINAGASLIVVAAIVLFPNLNPPLLVYFAFMGAAIGGLIVYSMASSGGGMTPVKLALAGIAVHFLLSSMTEGLIILNDNKTASVLFWLAGSISGAGWKEVHMVLPWTLIGLISALLIARSITVLSLGEDTAKGLGLKVEGTRLAAGVIVIVLAGASVAVAGPIGFVGLMIPHIAKWLVGVDYRLVIPASAFLGSILLIYADIASRFIAYPFEAPVGIVTAMLGTPFFLYLARKGRKLK